MILVDGVPGFRPFSTKTLLPPELIWTYQWKEMYTNYAKHGWITACVIKWKNYLMTWVYFSRFNASTNETPHRYSFARCVLTRFWIHDWRSLCLIYLFTDTLLNFGDAFDLFYFHSLIICHNKVQEKLVTLKQNNNNRTNMLGVSNQQGLPCNVWTISLCVIKCWAIKRFIEIAFMLLSWHLNTTSPFVAKSILLWLCHICVIITPVIYFTNKNC